MTTHHTSAPDFQLGLFDRPAPAQGHSTTSQVAAMEIEPRAGTLRGFVLAYLRGKGSTGATDEQIQEDLNMNPSTQRPRRIELVAADLVRDSGMTRTTRSGRGASVWLAITCRPFETTPAEPYNGGHGSELQQGDHCREPDTRP